jgi:hypothetical protein
MIQNVESIDPFFTLVARGFTPKHMDIFFLIKEQIAMMGVNIDPIFTIAPDGDSTEIRDFDLAIIEFQSNMSEDPFFADFYSENGTMNTSGYDIDLDWEIDLDNGKNQWFIENGLEMISNDSEEKINHCWEWQNYLLDDVLSCLPLFTNGNSTLFLVYNLRQVRPVLGSREACPGYAPKAKGLGVRKALTYAINREEIKNVAMGDDYEIIHHPINPNLSDWLNPNVVRYCHSLRAARDLMTIVGYDICWMPSPYTYIGFGPWPKWEDVCSGKMTTYSNPGFELVITITVLFAFSLFYLIKNRLLKIKNRINERERKRNE